MRITFILSSVYLTGGAKVICEYANRLTARGHRVTVVYPLIPLRFGAPWFDVHTAYVQMMQGLGNLRKGVQVPWFDLRASLLRPLTLTGRFIPDGDIVVATAWPTAYYVNRYPLSKGEKLYFIQSYEIWSGSGPKSLVDGTWTLPLRKIVIASWLKEVAERQFGQRVDGPIINGVNLEHFYGEPRTTSARKRVGMQWHYLEIKGVQDGLRAFERGREVFPDLQLVLFGTHRFPGIPDDAEFHLAPPLPKLREIYASCNVFLSPSWWEGCQLPPMEAMACGCAVVATNVGGIPDYAIPCETALVVPPKRPDLLADALIELLKDDEKRRCIALSGQRHIRQFTWDRATDQLESQMTRMVSQMTQMEKTDGTDTDRIIDGQE